MVAKAVAFTENRVRRFSCPAGKDYELNWDTEQRGLGVRVTKNGARSYVFESRVHRRTVRVTIGDVDDWKLGEARKEARRLKVLADRGVNPRDERRAKAAEAEAAHLEAQRSGLILAGVWNAYVKAQSGHWGERHTANHGKLAHAGGERKKKGGGKGLTMAGPLAPLMALKLSELSAERIASWLKRETRTRPTSAAQAFRALRAFIRWTADVPEYRGIVPPDAYSARTVREVVPRARAKEGDCLQREQLPAWFKAVRALSSRVISTYLQTLLLTGPRRDELAALRWADVDFHWSSITLRDKVDGKRTIPLTPYVRALLEKLPRKNEWVFSSHAAKGGRMVEPRIAHNHALEAAGLPHLSIHGLRRSFGTLSEWIEMPVGIVAQLQGHAPSALAEKHYRRRPLDLLRLWHEKLETWILEQGGIPFTRSTDKARLGVVSADGSVQPVA
jgi:integrase